MMISIVIPTFNSQRFIEATLRSVINAGESEHFEVIVVDGGSSDETINIINQYTTKMPIRLFRQLGTGMYGAINQGIQCSSGEIVGYLNSDDELLPQSLSLVRKVLNDSGSFVVYGGLYYIGPDDETIACLRFLNPSYPTFVSCSSMPIGQPGTFWKSSLHRSVGYFDDHYSIAGDFEFFCRLRGFTKFTNLGVPIARYRIHKHSLTNNNARLGREEVLRIRTKYAAEKMSKFEIHIRSAVHRFRYGILNFAALYIIRRRKRLMGLKI